VKSISVEKAGFCALGLYQ